MKTADEVMAIWDSLKGERAPGYIPDETGIAARAIFAARKRWHDEWNRDATLLPYDDEIPY